MPTFQSLTSPSWMSATSTRPPASRSCSGAPRAPTLSPATTALTTQSFSRYDLPSRCPCPAVALSAPESLALLAPPSSALAHAKRSPLGTTEALTTVSCPGSALDLRQLSSLPGLWKARAGKSCSLCAPPHPSQSEPSPSAGQGRFQVLPSLW